MKLAILSLPKIERDKLMQTLLADKTKDRAWSGRDLEGWVQAAEQKALLRALQDGGPENFAIGLDDFGEQFLRQ